MYDVEPNECLIVCPNGTRISTEKHILILQVLQIPDVDRHSKHRFRLNKSRPDRVVPRRARTDLSAADILLLRWRKRANLSRLSSGKQMLVLDRYRASKLDQTKTLGHVQGIWTLSGRIQCDTS